MSHCSSKTDFFDKNCYQMISQETLRTDFEVNNRPVFAQKISKETGLRIL